MTPQPLRVVPISSSPLAEASAVPRQAMAGYASVTAFHITHLLGAAFPAVAGVMLFGWRALAMLILMLIASLIALGAWRRIGLRGGHLHASQAIWPTVLLWLMMPAHLMGTAAGDPPTPLWAIPIGAAILLIVMMWLLAGTWVNRIPAVAAAYLIVAWIFGPTLWPTSVLQRDRLFFGDIARAAAPAASAYIKDGFLRTEPLPHADALALDPPARKLLAFTSGREKSGRSRLSLESLLRDQMPPLEDLVMGGYPGPIGGTCAIAIIIGGLFLLYRGVIDYRVPLAICIGAYLALLTLPIPVIIREQIPPPATASSAPGITQPVRRASVTPPPAAPHASSPRVPGGAHWRWMAFRDSIEVGWAKAITFANYEVLAGPLLLMTFFVATWPGVRPMARRGRVLFGLLAGILAAGLQIYVSISWGPYLALVIVSLLSPLLDRMFRQHPLV